MVAVTQVPMASLQVLGAGSNRGVGKRLDLDSVLQSQLELLAIWRPRERKEDIEDDCGCHSDFPSEAVTWGVRILGRLWADGRRALNQLAGWYLLSQLMPSQDQKTPRKRARPGCQLPATACPASRASRRPGAGR